MENTTIGMRPANGSLDSRSSDQDGPGTEGVGYTHLGQEKARKGVRMNFLRDGERCRHDPRSGSQMRKVSEWERLAARWNRKTAMDPVRWRDGASN